MKSCDFVPEQNEKSYNQARELKSRIWSGQQKLFQGEKYETIDCNRYAE